MVENIQIKNWKMKDAEELVKICNHMKRAYLSDMIPYPYTLDDAVNWLNMVEEKEGKEGIFRAITVDNEYVGNISVEKKRDVYSKDSEIGYFVLEDKCSRGIATEAVKQICDIAFGRLDIIRITGLVYGPNIASKRVLEKNGFVQEGQMKNAVNKEGNIYDLCIYGKCKSGN